MKYRDFYKDLLLKKAVHFVVGVEGAAAGKTAVWINF